MYRHLNSLVVFLAIAAACSGENNPVEPASAPRSVLTAPTSIAADYTATPVLLTYTTSYTEAVPIVRGYESDANSMSYELGVPKPTFTVQVASTGLSTRGLSASQLRVPGVDASSPGRVPARRAGGGARGRPPVSFYLPAGCTKEYIECVYDCLYTRLNFENALGDFWRADDEYWDNVLHGKDYLNHLNGGPQTRMYSNVYLMAKFARQWRAIGCKNYV